MVAKSRQKVWWQCDKTEDHEWEVSVCGRTSGSGCPCCCGRKVVKSNCLTTTHPNIANEWHLTKNGTMTPNDITYACNTSYWWQCLNNPKHEWITMVSHRTNGSGCPFCNLSKGENKIKEILDLMKISYKQQYKFIDCVNKRPLPFDFVLLKEDIVIGAIEFQGRQHYEPVSYFGGNTGHELTKKTDIIKFNYCQENKIPFLSIPFWNLAVIQDKLKEFIKII